MKGRVWLGTLMAALLGGVAAMLFVMTLGLIVSEFVVFPLALAIAALLAALCASWAATLLAADSTRTHLLRVVGWSEAAAALLAIVLLAIAAFRGALLGPVIFIAIGCGVLLAISATVAAGRFRVPKVVQGDGRLTVGLLLLAVVAIPTAIFLAWLAGLAGA